MYRASDLAKYVIAYENELATPVKISNLRLQKTLYYIQGYFFKQYNHSAFEEFIYNWTYGPVVATVYYEYSVNTYKPIIIPYNERSSILEDFATFADRMFINKIINICNKYSTSELVNKTHEEEPWKNTQRNQKISVSSMREFFYNNDPLQLYS